MLGYGFPDTLELIVVGGMLLVLVIVVAMRSGVNPKTHACADSFEPSARPSESYFLTFYATLDASLCEFIRLSGCTAPYLKRSCEITCRLWFLYLS